MCKKKWRWDGRRNSRKVRKRKTKGEEIMREEEREGVRKWWGEGEGGRTRRRRGSGQRKTKLLNQKFPECLAGIACITLEHQNRSQCQL